MAFGNTSRMDKRPRLGTPSFLVLKIKIKLGFTNVAAARTV